MNEELFKRMKEVALEATQRNDREWVSLNGVHCYADWSDNHDYFHLKFEGVEFCYTDTNPEYDYSFLEKWVSDMEKAVVKTITVNGKKYQLIEE